MPKLPLLPARRVIRALVRLGFSVDHQKGSHVVLKDAATGTRTVVVPDHPELDRGTLRSILSQAGVDVETLLAALLLVGR